MAAQERTSTSGPVVESVKEIDKTEERIAMYAASVGELLKFQRETGASEQVMLRALEGLANVAAARV